MRGTHTFPLLLEILEQVRTVANVNPSRANEDPYSVSVYFSPTSAYASVLSPPSSPKKWHLRRSTSQETTQQYIFHMEKYVTAQSINFDSLLPTPLRKTLRVQLAHRTHANQPYRGLLFFRCIRRDVYVGEHCGSCVQVCLCTLRGDLLSESGWVVRGWFEDNANCQGRSAGELEERELGYRG